MIDFNAAQKEAISHRDGDMLVCAGAGSGKTMVLKERVLALVGEGVPLEEMLVVTFTNAAAAEMRQRITDGLMRMDSPFAREQAQLAQGAHISTVHKFCIDILRQHFALVGLDPDFKVAQEDICDELKQEALDELFEELYAKEDAEFLEFAAYFDDNDGKMMDLIRQSYSFSRSHPRPEEFLRDAVQAYGTGELFVRELVREALQNADAALRYMRRAMETAKQAGLERVGEILALEAAELEQFSQMAEEDYAAAAGFLFKTGSSLAFPRKDVDEEAREQIKADRKSAREIAKKLVESPLNESRERLRAEMDAVSSQVAQTVRLTGLFAKKYAGKKEKRQLLDFSDLEHYAIGALCAGAAEDYREKFRYIFVDEYQDITQVQEELLLKIGRENLFMVGDVKQSIYRFRMGDPALFLKKSAGDGKEAVHLVNLNENYRCDREIVEFVNGLFSRVMSQGTGEIDYEGQKMVFGSGRDGGEVQLVAVVKENSGQDEALLEAAACVRRIRELKDRGYDYGDIAVLMRSVKGFGETFVQALADGGIPVFADFGGGYLAAQEVELALDFLSLVDNRRQDIPLLAVLRSFLGGFDEEELALMRLEFPEGEYFDALLHAAGRQTETGEKARSFLALLDRYRELAQVYSVEELTARLLFETPFYDYVQALPGGEQRKANLDLLLQRARDFEQSSFKGLYLFLRYIRRLQEKGQDLDTAKERGENQDAVRVTTIHKSKGLEFPAVIVARMGKMINFNEGKSFWAFHKDMGLAIRYADPALRIRRQGVAYAALVSRLNREILSEEMRMLYVAVTRPEKSLTLLGCLKDASLLKQRGVAPAPQNARRYFDWIGFAYAGRIDVREDFGQAQEAVLPEREQKQAVCGEYDAYVRERMEPGYGGGRALPSKLAASKVAAALEMGELAAALPMKELKTPLFRMRDEISAARRGTVWHLLMQVLNLEDTSVRAVRNTLDELVERELIFQEEAMAVGAEAVSAFYETPLGQRMKASRKVLRELPFNMAVSERELLGEGDGELLVQGIVDCCFLEGGGYVLVDYKTDSVVGDSAVWAKRHEMQLELYRRALEMSGMEVVESWIVFFSTGEAVRMWPKRGEGVHADSTVSG